MRTLAIIIIMLCASARAADVWLTKERAAQLRAITSRPYITSKRELGKGIEELRWTNGSRSWVTTQAVQRVAGAKAAHGWQKRVDAAKAEKAALLADVKALAAKGSASKKELKAVVEKSEKSQKEKVKAD